MSRRWQTGKAHAKKVVRGVLSIAKIRRERVLPGMRKSSLLEVRAIASRAIDALSRFEYGGRWEAVASG